MARRKKRTPLEDQVLEAWEKLAFADRGFAGKPLGRAELTERELKKRRQWDAILAMAFDGEAWLVGNLTAGIVTGSRWKNAMIVKDYKRAEDDIVRCLRHPGTFIRHDRADLPVRLEIARFAAGGWQSDASIALQNHIGCGVFSRSKMAFYIGHDLAPLIEDFPPQETTSDAARSLLQAIAVASRASKEVVQRCETALTWGEFLGALHDVLWPPKLTPVDGDG